ncbi:MAG: sulfotransferase domain-containing protein [Gammaproteobacteria bacterium]|nr:sulfotransferase domain-containing protein [Gammaproteobacteria bacterium]MBU2478164.1 sulfotransferase domain-containing protein [Gammaproteobacteria bacterium]
MRNMIRTYRGTDLFVHDRLLKPREVIMSHRLFRWRFGRSIVVVRDPRDMYVSFYHFQTSYEKPDRHSPIFEHFHHDPQLPVEEDFCNYLRARLLYPAHPWFFFSQFLDSWLNRPSTCIVRYEDCLADPEAALIRMLRFLGETVDLDRVRDTVRNTSFAAITAEKYGESRAAGQEDKSKFHRKGIAGDWRSYFNEEACILMEKFEGQSLRRLGYESDSHWVERHLGTQAPLSHESESRKAE